MRAQEEWNVITHIAFARAPTSAITRSRISLAALLVKVIARISDELRLLGADQIGDPMGERAGLAGTGAGEDQQRPLAMGDRLPLGLVQPLEQRFGGGGGAHLLHDRARLGRS